MAVLLYADISLDVFISTIAKYIIQSPRVYRKSIT